MTATWKCLPLLGMLVATLVVASCSEAAEPGGGAEPAVPGVNGSATPKRIEVQHLLDGDPSDFPVLRTRLPESVPRADAALPSLLEDPPGRALMTYHPPEITYAGPEGWVSEDILFYGNDGRWRRLRMEDLGLPEADWIRDTYGAGSLSDDGRWWAGMTGRGAVVVDLATGAHQVIDAAGYMPTPTWIPGEDAFIALTYVGRRSVTVRVSVPDGKITPAPYQQDKVGFEPDGTALTAKRDTSGALTLYEWDGDEKSARVVLAPQIPTNGRPLVTATSGRFASLTQRASDNYDRVTITVASSADGHVEASLRFRLSRLALFGSGHWLDPQTYLLVAEGHLLAWRPLAGEMYRVMDVPLVPPDRYWSVAFSGEQA